MASRLLKSAWLAGTMLFSPALAADDVLRHDALHIDLKQKACDNQFTILGDTNHKDGTIMNFVAEEATLKSLKDCGINKLFLEVRPDKQEFIDDFINGGMSREDLLKNIGITKRANNGEIADVIKNAADIGIEVIAADISSQELDTNAHGIYISMGMLALAEVVKDSGDLELAKKVRDFATLGIPLSAEDNDQYALTLFENKDHPSFAEGFGLLAEADRIKAQNVSRTDDTFLARFIKDHTAPGEHVAILFGNAHAADRSVGIDVQLGPENTAWIALKGEGPVLSLTDADVTYDLTKRAIASPVPRL
jgi:hypothetical protein